MRIGNYLGQIADENTVWYILFGYIFCLMLYGVIMTLPLIFKLIRHLIVKKIIAYRTDPFEEIELTFSKLRKQRDKKIDEAIKTKEQIQLLKQNEKLTPSQIITLNRLERSLDNGIQVLKRAYEI